MTVAFWEVQAGAPIREHNHFNEQVMTVTEGEFELTINGATHIHESRRYIHHTLVGNALWPGHYSMPDNRYI